MFLPIKSQSKQRIQTVCRLRMSARRPRYLERGRWFRNRASPHRYVRSTLFAQTIELQVVEVYRLAFFKPVQDKNREDFGNAFHVLFGDAVHDREDLP